MVFKIFQNCFPLYQLHYTPFSCQKNRSTIHFNKYDESIIIWYGLWCKAFGISKVQYVMVTQNLFMKFIHHDHITCNFIFLSHFHILLHKTNTKWLVHSWSTFSARTNYGQLGLIRFTTARTWGKPPPSP
jgi:hypothetical protein